MEIIDITLIVIIGGFALVGFAFGFIRTLGSLLGIIFGAYLASRYYIIMADWLMQLVGWEGNLVRVLMFVIAFLFITKLVGIVLSFFLGKIFKLIKWLPFVKTFDRLLGLLLGLAEGILVIGLIIFFIERFPLSEKIMSYLAGSVVAPYASGIASILWPLLPDAIQLLRSTVDYIENIVL